MFVMTAKLSKPKLIAAGLVLVVTVVLIVLLALSGKEALGQESFSGATNEERLAFLATYGWSVNAELKESQKVKIPDTTDNEVFNRYNELQISQGFDLREHAGKEAMRYVYEILNYPDATDPVYASILVCDGIVIGGDVTDTATDGVIHGFALPSQQLSQTTQSATETEEPASQVTETQEEPASTD